MLDDRTVKIARILQASFDGERAHARPMQVIVTSSNWNSNNGSRNSGLIYSRLSQNEPENAHP